MIPDMSEWSRALQALWEWAEGERRSYETNADYKRAEVYTIVLRRIESEARKDRISATQALK